MGSTPPVQQPLKFTLSPGEQPEKSWKLHQIHVSYLEEVTEQINVLTDALNQIRETKDGSDTFSVNSKSSIWKGSMRMPSKTTTIHLSPLPANQHPLLVGLWSKSHSDRDFRSHITNKLLELIDERRKFLRGDKKEEVNRYLSTYN